jgi:anti-sigma regulatory factor (Ser/Thr protein kinase)
VTLDSTTPEPIVLSLDRTVDAPRRARNEIRVLAAELGEERTEDAMLLVSELVTNAVKYGGEGPVEIVVDRTGGHARFTVRDRGGPGPLPEIRTPGTAGGGHGLRLVDSISDRWGVAHGSTIVWFEFDLG